MGLVFSAIILILAAWDQALKAIVNANLLASDRIVVIEGFFYLINRKNPGAAWSFLADPWWGIYVLSVVSLIVTGMMWILIFRSRHRGLQEALTLICGGSLGNLIDRIRVGEVTDYLDFHFGNYVFPTFNLADILIVCGTAWLILLVTRDHRLLDEPWLTRSPRKDAMHAKDSKR